MSRPTLNIQTFPTTLIFQVDGQELRIGIPIPIGIGEVNAGENVGGESEVFRDTALSVMNFRTLRGVGGVSVNQNGDVIDISKSPTAQFPADPSVDDDGTVYAVGDHWINTVTGTVWVITDNTIGAAVWSQVGGPAWVEDAFTATLGQVTFILSEAPTDGGSLEFDVNGVTYENGVDYSRSGVTVTWLNNSFSMEVGDTVLVRYR